MTMARVLILLLSLALLFGCATATPQAPSGMKRITETPGISEVAFQSVEKKMSVMVMGFG
jgi:hypothetical protein